MSVTPSLVAFDGFAPMMEFLGERQLFLFSFFPTLHCLETIVFSSRFFCRWAKADHDE